jgi:predicted SAM-dependent methyltransferase
MKDIKIDLGSGRDKKDDTYYGVDRAKIENVDIICDLDLRKHKNLPFLDSSIDSIFTRHFLEHIHNPLFVIEEIYRVLKKGGIVEIIVPHWSWYGSHTFMHNKFFHSKDFDFFDKDDPYNYYTIAKFRVISKKIVYNKGKIRFWSKPISYFIEKMLNKNHLFSEQFLVNFLTPTEIRVVMKKV